jgi:hypothetical protein
VQIAGLATRAALASRAFYWAPQQAAARPHCCPRRGRLIISCEPQEGVRACAVLYAGPGGTSDRGPPQATPNPPTTPRSLIHLPG